MDFEKLKKSTFLYPTDTTFGLGCVADDLELIQKIYTIKNRPRTMPLIVLVENEARLQKIADVPELAWDIMDMSEKPVTIIYEHPKNILKELIAPDNTIAIRMTKDPFCSRLISRLNCPIVSTSANISGESSPGNFQEISEKIKNEVDYIFPECENFTPKFKASSIIKLAVDGRVEVIRE